MTNPSGSVSVAALPDGGVVQMKLDDELIVGAAELPTSDQADAAQAHVFATRYVDTD
ncbi:MAG: hypothetical protein VYA67_00240 [Actinomycetota bacterium]|uniref:Uncharacterized protein n=1 Tax=Mycobacterium lentiflavum TaxID=141349 RepID=A0ABY3V120_MYCLN|nr:hypothetical protein [Mycobacterium lentiflavum]MEE3062381.1 hypothetical protein [Actinomycetota bacterium]ULP44647.1 hypothetical protein MJO58_12460 [Mycobacterium lentiflavum]